MTRGAVLKLLSASAIASTAGCGPLRARLARAVHGCPVPGSPPQVATRLVTHTMRLTPASIANHVDAIALVPVTSDRIIFAFPGRGGTAADVARDISGYADLGAAHSIVVCVGGGESYWHPRTGGLDAMGEFLNEVVPWAREFFLMEPPYGIIGWSMGGFGAIAAAQRKPELFDRVCAVSPAIWPSYAQSHGAVPDAFDDDSQFQRFGAFNNKMSLRGIDARIVCGTSDAFFDNARAFAQSLGGITDASFTPIDHGCHEMETWHETMRDDFAFVQKRRRN